MIVFCCGMPRTGSTLQYLLTKEIVESCKNGRVMGFVNDNETFLERLQCIDVEREVVAIKCHRYLAAFDEVFVRGHGKAVFVYRDIRDALVSRLNHLDIDFDYKIARSFIVSSLKFYDAWTATPNVHVTSYEAMTADVMSEAVSIGGHLGIAIPNELAAALADKYGIDQQRQRIQEFDYAREGVRTNTSVYDPETQLHQNHIHSGASEQWRSSLTEEQVRFVESLAGEWLTERGYRVSNAVS